MMAGDCEEFKQRDESICATSLLSNAGFIAHSESAPKEEMKVTPSEAPTVRMIYLVPSDRVIRPDFLNGITSAALHLQRWYWNELGERRTFLLPNPIVEPVQTQNNADWYATHDTGSNYWFWENTLADGFASTGGRFNDPNNIWIYYIDAQNNPTKPGGGGAAGVAVLPQTDMLGLIGASDSSICRWIGGLGHELGHALGLPHPPLCDNGELPQSDPQCQSLMYLGYLSYPQTYFLPPDKEKLEQSPFMALTDPLSMPFECALLPCSDLLPEGDSGRG